MCALELVHAGPEHGAGIRRLLATVFPNNPKSDDRIMRWQYWENPFGPADSWVWLDDGQVVSHYASIPVPIRMGERMRLGCLSVDAATAPEYRNLGLYQKALESDARSAEADFAIALWFETFPRHTGRWSVGYAAFEPFILPLDSAWLAARLHVPRVVAAGAVNAFFRTRATRRAHRVDDLPADLDEIWSAAHARNEWAIQKDAAWWRWRFAAHPYGVYRYFESRENGSLQAAAVTRSGSYDGRSVEYVLELLARDGAAARAVISCVVESTDAAALVARSTAASPLRRWARACGFRRVPARFQTERPRMVWYPARVKDKKVVALPWAVTYGDTDAL